MGASSQVQMTQSTNEANESIAKTTGSYDLKIAQAQSNSAIETAKQQAEAAKYQADKQLDAVKEQAKADIEIAKMEYEIKLKEAQNEANRISTVDYTNALANMESARAQRDKAAALSEKYQLMYGQGGAQNGSYYYYG